MLGLRAPLSALAEGLRPPGWLPVVNRVGLPLIAVPLRFLPHPYDSTLLKETTRLTTHSP